MKMFKDFDYHKCESLKRIKEEMRVFKGLQVESAEEALYLSTKLPSVSPQDFLEEMLKYWDETEVPLLKDKRDRFVMAQIHSMVLKTYTKYSMAEGLHSKVWKYWSDTKQNFAQTFCGSLISSGRLDMTYEDLRSIDCRRLACDICLGYSRASEYLRIGFIGLDLETIQRAASASCCNFEITQNQDHEDRYYTEGMVGFLEEIRCKLRRRILI